MAKTSKKTTPFGLHLMIDAYDCSSDALKDANVIYKILDELPIKLGMNVMTKPYVVRASGKMKKDPGGWSGFVMIEESHISIHTFPKRRFLTADIYSCKAFDTEVAIAYFKDIFKTRDTEIMIESRGKRYPEENVE